MAEQSAAKNAFILTWLKDTRDADKPIENNPDTKVVSGYQKKEVEYLIEYFLAIVLRLLKIECNHFGYYTNRNNK